MHISFNCFTFVLSAQTSWWGKMKTQFDETKRMQLIKGSKVRCIKSVAAHPDVLVFEKNKGTNDFTSGKVYEVPFANSLLGDVGGSHTWSIEVFRKHFIELSNGSLT